ncbi:MAG TPA: hypothetical protein VHC97_14575 [Thermoanaerobaculia bacterium]|jgi:hypothetical protein|nr:hypothetical protein [Thermoanaerobaculia bacterium]
MWTASDGFLKILGKRSLRAAFAAGAILLVLGSGAVYAAPQSATNPPVSAEERGELRRVLESRYEVLPVSGGIALKPRKARAGIRTIEVTGNQVAVNGEPVSARTLRDWLGEDADSILRLQGLSAAEQRQMFALEDAGVEEPAPEPEASPAPSEETPAATTSDVDVTEVTGETGTPPAPPEVPEAPEPPEVPARHNAGPLVNVGGSVHVERDQVVEEAVAIGGSATVDGEVTDSVTAIGGPARIEGRVGGDITAVAGSVYLGSNAVVEGNVTTVGGRIHREPGSRIEGVTSEVGLFPWRHRGWAWDGDWGPFRSGVSDVMGSLVWLILMGLLVCLTLLVARRPLERVDRQLTAQPWRSALAGILGFIFFWPLFFVVTVLLAITIIGCALFLLYPFLLLYVLLLLILGYTAVAYRVGRWIEVRFNRSFGGPYATALVGVLVIQIWSVLGNFLDIIPFMGVFAFVTGLFGFLVQLAAWVTGFGAVILSRFGLEPGYWPRRGAPVPPPPPYAPPPSYDVPPAGPADRLPLTEPRWEEPGEYPGPYPPPPPEGTEPR